MDAIIQVNGKALRVDAEDVKRIIEHLWHRTSEGRVQTKINRKAVSLQRFIMQAKEGESVIFKTEDINDYRKSNLEITKAPNRGRRKSQSGYIGVYPFKDRKGVYRAVIQGRTIGYFRSAEEAAKAYDTEAIKVFGPNASLNLSPDKN